MNDLIEDVARAIQIAAMSGHVESADRSWNENSERYREEWRVQARAAIAAVHIPLYLSPPDASALAEENRRLRDALGRADRALSYPVDTRIQARGFGVRTDDDSVAFAVETLRAARYPNSLQKVQRTPDNDVASAIMADNPDR